MIEDETVQAALIAVGAALLTAGAAIWVNYANAARLRRQPFLEKQLDLALEASSLAAILATTRSKKAFDRAYRRFLELYWGPLSVVENKGVANAMFHFHRALHRLIRSGAPLPLEALQPRSFQLARQVRQLILSAWKIPGLARILESRKDQGGAAESLIAPQKAASPP